MSYFYWRDAIAVWTLLELVITFNKCEDNFALSILELGQLHSLLQTLIYPAGKSIA